MTLEPILFVGAVTAAIVWAAVSAYVLYVGWRRAAARRRVATCLALLEQRSGQAETGATLNEVRGLLGGLSREMILHTAADPTTPPHAFEKLSAHLVERWPIELLVDEASSHRRQRDVWRRTAALRILFHLNHSRIMELLDDAVFDPDVDVSAAALSLLGSSTDPAAVDIMIRALKSGRVSPARVAINLEGSPQRPAAALRDLLTDADPVARAWAARLLGDYRDVPGLDTELLQLVHDAEPEVRKAAIVSLGHIGDDAAARAAVALLDDRVPFVRAHAARALGDLERSEHASDVAALLGDADWWVRAAAKQALEAMGPDVWTALVPCLDHPDRFVRNAAAEVFQDLGVLDNLVVMEAASDNPSPAKIDLLRRIAEAGGARLTQSLVERAGPSTGPKVRRLLASIGLEHVGAA